MKRGPFFLAAALVEVLRFFIFMTLAAALGFLQATSPLPSMLRYAASAQLLFVAALVFLWIDADTYAAYRPLAIAGKAVSLAAYVPLALSFASGRGVEGAMATGLVPAAASIVPAADLAVLLVLATYRRRTSSRAPEIGEGGAQRGPEDIEAVERLP